MSETKVVVNVCFGGFSLSARAASRLAELQGRKAYFFKPNQESGFLDQYTSIAESDATGLFWTAFDVPNPAEVIGSSQDWQSWTMEKRQAWGALYASHRIPLSGGEIERDDPLLVQVVEELGDAAGGDFSKLRVAEIPADVEYTIEEYDGNEHIAEAHRTWS